MRHSPYVYTVYTDVFFPYLDTDVAPLWDPERRQFVGLMTVEDYIQALRVWRYTYTYIYLHNTPMKT